VLGVVARGTSPTLPSLLRKTWPQLINELLLDIYYMKLRDLLCVLLVVLPRARCRRLCRCLSAKYSNQIPCKVHFVQISKTQRH
jgi:hypothetical protein